MIKFVFFDLGGVVIQDFSGTNNWLELKKEIGITDSTNEAFEQFWEKYEGEVCLGRDLDTLIPLIKDQFGWLPSKNYSFLLDGFVKRFSSNNSIHPVIKKIAATTDVGLLTNMYPEMFNAIKNLNFLPEIHWQVIIDSSVEKIKKPDQAIFELAEKLSSVKGEEILFVENSLMHIKAAQEIGWKTFHYDSYNPQQSSLDLLNFWEKLQ